MDNNKILLGKVKEIHQLKLIISLPHNKIGVCKIENISLAYTKVLEQIGETGNQNDDAEENVKILSSLFCLGQTVQVKTMASSGNKQNVSLMPSEINADINIKHIKSEMKLQVAIQSCEDKGYILETGISGLNGFLPHDKCRNIKYSVGQLLEASPVVNGGRKKSESASRVVTFTLANEKLQSNSILFPEFSCILPGMIINAHLKLSNDGTLEGTYQGFPVIVKADHQLFENFKEPEQALCVIGVDGTLKSLDCSLLKHLIPPYTGADDLLSTQIGHSQTNCILKKIQKHQLTFSLPNLKYSKAFIKKEHIDVSLKDLKIGESTTIRYMDFNLLDNVINATCLKNLLSLSYFSVNQAKVGEIIKGTIKGYKKIGFAVQISSQLSGFIPIQHLKDSLIKVPSMAYKSGEEIRCRVFYIDHEKNKLILTVKKSFMNSTLPIVTAIEDLKPGITVDGFVAKITNFGILIIMFNNLKGWLRKSDIPNGDKIDLNVMFHKGMPLQVRVVSCDIEKEKVHLSMLEPKEFDEEEEHVESSKERVQVEVGQIYECVVKKVMKNGFNVRLMPFNKPAFLTFEQLSDSREHNTLLRVYFSTCGNTEIRTNVVIINTSGAVVSVSRKKSLIDAATDGRLLTTNHEIKVGSQWLGWVVRRESFGVFVELPTGITGLVPNRSICDLKTMFNEPKDLVEVGDTIEVKVVEFDAAKPKKSLFTIKMSDTYRAKEHMERGALSFLLNHLEERKYLKSLPSCSKVASFEIGDLIETKITGQLDWGYTLTVGGTVPGFIRNHHLPRDPLSVGSKQSAVIIDIDLAQQSIEVCMTGSVVNSVTNRNSLNKVTLKQVIKSDVLAFNSDFVVTMLLDHGHGNIAFIPTKRFWNDVSKEFCWIVNQRNPTVIKRALTSNTFIGSLKINEPIDIDTNTNKPETVLLPLTIKTLQNKIHLTVGVQYPVFFHCIRKNKIFFHISKKQKCFCNLIDFAESLDEIEQFVMSPPEEDTLMAKQITISETGHRGTGLAAGHFIMKEIIEEGDSLCCRVTSVSNKQCSVELPFKSHGIIDLSENDKNTVKINPKMGSIIQCKVDSVTGPKDNLLFNVSIVKNSNSTQESESISKENESMETDVAKGRKSRCKSKANLKRAHQSETECEDVSTAISNKRRRESEEEESKEFMDLYNETTQSDDEEDNEFDMEEENEPIVAKKQRLTRQSLMERELSIREAEERRESGETMKTQQTEAEFELQVFNYPNIAASWTRYMDFVLTASEDKIDKVRSIAERAISTISDREADSRFVVMKKYIDLELEQLCKHQNDENYDDQLKQFQLLLTRCLVHRTKEFYGHVCEKARSLSMLTLAELLAKGFVKDFAHDEQSWYQLALTRFVMKKYNVVKETMTNAERLLKADSYRELQFKMAKVEMEIGNKSRGENILKALMAARPKDDSLKQKCNHILAKAGLTHDNAASDNEM